MSKQLEKLEAHASHMLDAYIQLRERYAMLEPMLFSEKVTKERGAGRQAAGFRILKNTLFLSCIQDLAKLATDDDDRAPSFANLIRSLSDDMIRKELQERFATSRSPLVEEETDPQVREAIRLMEIREEAAQRIEFERLFGEAMLCWAKLSTSSKLKAFRKVRDKVTAHTEIRRVAEQYRPVDLGRLGIKWGDLPELIFEMQRLVEILGLLIRRTGFGWESLEKLLGKASQGFWATHG